MRISTMPPGAAHDAALKRATIQGFLTTDFALRYEEAATALAGWIREGKLRYRADLQVGIEIGPRVY